MTPGCNETAVACNETGALRSDSTCRECGCELQRPKTGRPPRFCCPTHRVRFHRRTRRTCPAAVAPPPPTAVVVQTESVERRRCAERLTELDEHLESLRAPRGAGRLRSIADAAEDLLAAVEAINDGAGALEEFDWDAAAALEALFDDHRLTLERLTALENLADDLDELARDIRAAARHRDAIAVALDDLEESTAEV